MGKVNVVRAERVCKKTPPCDNVSSEDTRKLLKEKENLKGEYG